MSSIALLSCWAILGFFVGCQVGPWARRLLHTRPLPCAAAITAPALTTVIFAGLAWRLGPGVALLAYSYLTAVLILLSLVDLAEQRLPTVVVMPSYLVLGAVFAIDAILEADDHALLRSFTGMTVLAAAYLAVSLASGGLGAGDVKLAGLLGLALGWWGWPALWTGTLLGWLAAAITLMTLRATGRARHGHSLALGPHLALGAFLAIGLNPSTNLQ